MGIGVMIIGVLATLAILFVSDVVVDMINKDIVANYEKSWEERKRVVTWNIWVGWMLSALAIPLVWWVLSKI